MDVRRLNDLLRRGFDPEELDDLLADEPLKDRHPRSDRVNSGSDEGLPTLKKRRPERTGR